MISHAMLVRLLDTEYVQVMDETELNRINTILRVLLGYRNLTMAELAGRLGMKAYNMSNRVTGRAPFTVADLRQMAEVLDVEPGVWFDEPENVFQYLKKQPQPDFRTGSGQTQPELAALPAPADAEAATLVA